MAGRLFVVATPIGNMGDLSPRAAEVLAAVDVVAAEDTRVTGGLLSRIGVSRRMVSYREQTEQRLSHELVQRMLAGESVALVSDAGTPTISDPGYRLVRAAAEAAALAPLLAIGAILAAGAYLAHEFFDAFGFKAKAAREEAEKTHKAIEEIEAALKGLLKPEYEEATLGSAEVREIFKSSKFGTIAGSMVTSGLIRRNAKARVLRDGVVIGDNLTIESLKRFKDDATEVREGYECGIGVGSFKDVQVGDSIEAFEMREKKRA